MGRTGLFGGTFNPIHAGHIHLAEESFRALKLDRMFLIPSNIPPHKQTYDLCSGEERAEMVRLALQDKEGFEVSEYEIKKEGKSYSYYTVMHFREMYPDDELFLIVGSDMFLSFDSWYRFEDILKEVTLAVVSREYNDRKMLEEKAVELEKFGHTEIIDANALPVSSTEVRRMIQNGENYSCYLSENVVQYIRLNGLYIKQVGDNGCTKLKK